MCAGMLSSGFHVAHRIPSSTMIPIARRFFAQVVWSVLLTGPLCAHAGSAAPPIPVRVVVVAMFERGEDTGDVPGEFQLWVEREHLAQVFDLAAGYHQVRM